MKPFPIPVRMLGPGSQPAEEDVLQVLQMDREVGTFAMPRIPASADDAHMAAARDLLAGFHDRLRAWQDGDGPELEMTHVAPGPLGGFASAASYAARCSLGTRSGENPGPAHAAPHPTAIAASQKASHVRLDIDPPFCELAVRPAVNRTDRAASRRSPSSPATPRDPTAPQTPRAAPAGVR